MIFKRRQRPPFWDRARETLYPRKGMWRGVHYLGKRVRRLPDSPHRIALGFACGAFASFTPLFGFHFVVAFVLAWLVRGNLIASAIGTAVGNPLTFPLIAASSLQIGWLLLGYEPHPIDDGLSFAWLVENVEMIFLPYLVGGILPGAVCAIAVYGILGPIVAAYQDRRRKKLEMLAERRRKAIDEEQAAYATNDPREGDNV